MLRKVFKGISDKFYFHFGFQLKEITFDRLVDYLHKPKHASSLAVTRILFGLAMLFDIPEERGGSAMYQRWGKEDMCHFPLFYFIRPILLPYMALVYAALWFGAVGIMIGYKYRLTSILFVSCYWYLFLIEKSFWNNHSYLFGLVSLLLATTQANKYWSVDAYLDKSIHSPTVPYWNYFVLKYQFFILYFVAGLKKGTAEWLTGYSLTNLSEHWVFDPFKLLLSVQQVDYLIVHWFAFLFDLTIAFWMMWSKTRHLAMLFCAAFHMMNIRLFRIGMFPWVCLATMPLYYPFDWPIRIINHIIKLALKIKLFCKLFWTKYACIVEDVGIQTETNLSDDDINRLVEISNRSAILKEQMLKELIKKLDDENEHIDESTIDDNKQSVIEEDDDKKDVVLKTDKHLNKFDKGQDNEGEDEKVKLKSSRGARQTSCLIFLYMLIQLFMPYSHFITKGYNNWTNGLYGYSWDMMVHTWDTSSIAVKIVDNNSKEQLFIDPEAWTPNNRWTRHADMVYQFAHCIKNNLQVIESPKSKHFDNISVYIDSWSSMNGRFQQRMFDSNIDLLQANWSPFKKVNWLMPLLIDADNWRSKLDTIRNEVHSWNNECDVLFVADYPDHSFECYFPPDITNITLTSLQGEIGVETEFSGTHFGYSHKLKPGESFLVPLGIMHTVHNFGQESAYYMYTYKNVTVNEVNNEINSVKLPLAKELITRFMKIYIFLNQLAKYLFDLFFRMPMWYLRNLLKI